MYLFNWSLLRKTHETKFVIAALILALCAMTGGSETITMRTWYPSPYGSYRRLQASEFITAGPNGKNITVGKFTDGGASYVGIQGSDDGLLLTSKTHNVTTYGTHITDALRLVPRACSYIASKELSVGLLCVDSADHNRLKIYNGGWRLVGSGRQLLAEKYYWFAMNSAVTFPVPSGTTSFNVWIEGKNIGGSGSMTSYDDDWERTTMFVDLRSGTSSGMQSVNAGMTDDFSATFAWNSAPLGAALGGYRVGDVNILPAWTSYFMLNSALTVSGGEFSLNQTTVFTKVVRAQFYKDE